MDLTAFAEAVRGDDAVTVTGLGTRGGPVPGARDVVAPAAIEEVAPAEMTVRCGAGTPVDELQAALADVGQMVALPSGGTVGGALAVGRSGVGRLGHGPVRDTLLQLRYVATDGAVVTAGGPTVKNVTGFDLCRLFVGSLGTLGFAGEVILRTRPLPACTRWVAGPADPFALVRRLHRPTAVLWDGVTTWVCLEGHPADVEAEAAVTGLSEVDGPPPLPTGGRASRPPSSLRSLPWTPGTFVAQVGVGVVHTHEPVEPEAPSAEVVELHRRLKASFDPAGRLNPGISPLRSALSSR
jgi:glycolate oxidase FAD binding subunit